MILDEESIKYYSKYDIYNNLSAKLKKAEENNEELEKDLQALRIAFAGSQNDIDEYDQENEGLRELLKDLVSLGINFGPYWTDRIKQALKQK